MLEVMPQRTPVLKPPHKLPLLPILTQLPAIILARPPKGQTETSLFKALLRRRARLYHMMTACPNSVALAKRFMKK
jgi:hypothetical protein